MSKHIIYGLVDPRTDEVRYIGKSTSGLNRPRQHWAPSSLARDKTHKGNWIRGLLADDEDPEIRVLAECEPEDLLDAEIFWIAYTRAD